ncbi:hypothetical protein [Frateuria sp. STR12]|uniref:hypothetical protein n=1 Tax=Frateuria hangzhouensis TaxID=2995589 RepID=UPI002260A4F1|nr:hypothetical protein [Frateuria sp. STR12]MCX7512309.1 hypothetical protein [Frateuria sp. STR12]
MNANDVIESYVVDVMRRLPGKDRNGIGLELRGLLTEMLDDRAQREGRAADDAMVLGLLHDFGTPAGIAARYRPPGLVIIPAEQTRSFALLSLGGIGLQWALTLPRVFQGQPASAWWFSWGLGSLWWPGFLVMMALVAVGVRELGLARPAWRPRGVDPDRIDRKTFGIGFAWFVIGAVFMTCLPWIIGQLPDPLPRVFAFDPAFLRWRAPPVVLLWLLAFVNLGVVYRQGRWSPPTRWLEIGIHLAFLALLAWWLADGALFLARSTNDGARGGIALAALFIALDLVLKLYRRRTRIHPPKIATG